MKILFKFLSIFTCLIVLISCKPSSMGYENDSNDDEIIYADYSGDVDYYADSKGIHISIPLEGKKINKIVLYEEQGTKELKVAVVAPVSPLYYYAFDGTPCGEKMYQVNNGVKTEISAFYRTNYLEGTINIDLCFVEPEKNYNFVLYLYEPVYITGGGSSDLNNNRLSEEFKTRYSKRFTIRAFDESLYSGFIEAEYDSEKDKFTVKPIDIKSLNLPFEINDYSDITITASALYKGNLDSNQIQLSVPLAINPDTSTEVSLSEIAEKIDDIDFDSDYTLDSISGSLEFKEHLEKTINDSSTDDEKRKYYEKLYSQKSFSYCFTYINGSGIPEIVNMPDKRMPVFVTSEADDNLVSFNFPTNATMINIYRKSAGEKDFFLAGTMKGSFTSGNSYSFPDYYAETGKTYTYYVTWDGGRKSKSASVTTTSIMKYKPNAPEMTYSYLEESKSGSFSVIVNPFKNKLPDNYKGSIDFVYGIQEKYYFTKVFDFTVKDSDTEVYI